MAHIGENEENPVASLSLKSHQYNFLKGVTIVEGGAGGLGHATCLFLRDGKESPRSRGELLDL